MVEHLQALLKPPALVWSNPLYGQDNNLSAAEEIQAEESVNTNAPKGDELIDAKIAAAEARTETKIARVEGKIDLMGADLSAKIGAVLAVVSETKAQLAADKSERTAHLNNNRNAIVTTVFGVGVGIVALLIAVMTYGDSIFSRGMSVREIVKALASEQHAVGSAPAPLK
jgi:hypothetical protein